jgi:hypothetical protein
MTHYIAISSDPQEPKFYGFIRDGKGILFDFEKVFDTIQESLDKSYQMTPIDNHYNLPTVSSRRFCYDKQLSLKTINSTIGEELSESGQIIVGCFDEIKSLSEKLIFVSNMMVISKTVV